MNALEHLAKVTGSVTIQNGIATLDDGTVLDLAKALAQQNEVVASLHDTLRPYQTGECQDSKNPYRRPYVERGLKAIKEITGFEGNWMDASPV